MNQDVTLLRFRKPFPKHGYVGLVLVTVFWWLNWSKDGLRTHWVFFPLWLGYCLLIDALVYTRKGTSLMTRDWRKYIGLFAISAPVWWIFEALNYRLHNWQYVGSEFFSKVEFWFWATLNFTTVAPAVFGSAELLGSFGFIRKAKRKLWVIRPTRQVTFIYFLVGLGMFILMMLLPNIFFPFAWLSLFFMVEPVNVWLGNSSLTRWTKEGDWRPIFALWMGVLLTAFFWEMWNYCSYPKWIYHIPWGNCCKIFEMPLLGYGGYLPFALELYALYNLIMGFVGQKQTAYLQLLPE